MYNMWHIKTEPGEYFKPDPFFSYQTLEHNPATQNTRQIKTEPTENIKPDPFFSNKTLEHIPATYNMEQIKIVPNEHIQPDPFGNVNRPEWPSARQYPILPLPNPPKCRDCGKTSQKRENVLASNRNGNAGRPYYVCNPCEKTGERVWITWDDRQGIHPDNPDCQCDLVCRKDRAGFQSTSCGREFLICAIGRCGYWQWVDPEEQILGDNETTEESATLRVEIKIE